MAQQLLLIAAICRHGIRRRHLESIPDAIELPHAAAEFSGNFGACVCGRLGAPSPAPRKFVEVIAVRPVAANRQPLALRQARDYLSGMTTQLREDIGPDFDELPVEVEAAFRGERP